MSLRIACRCGKRLRVREEHVGMRARCPACQESFRVGRVSQRWEASSSASRLDHNAPNLALLTDSAPSQLLSSRNNAVPSAPQRQNRSPLDESTLQALARAERQRRVIRRAAIVIRILFLLDFASAATSAAMMLIFAATATRAISPHSILFAVLSVALISGVALLKYFAYKATWECREWGPLTMAILFGLSSLSCLWWGFLAAFMPGADFIPIAAGIFIAIIPGIIAVICYQAWTATPRYLEQPAWCRDALTYCEL